ncbi:MAG: rRNA maturation RNase YbeY [Bacteroidales bacterium]
MISFHSLMPGFQLKKKREIKSWIKRVIETENQKLGQVDIIFCSDEYLLEMNVKYLNHNYITDIITFGFNEDPEKISGDLFISVERVEENAQAYNTTFDDELRRVIVHGILHLIGYDDKEKADKQIMTGKEDFYLSEFNKIVDLR